MTGFVVISPDPRGFWHADYWAAEEGATLEEISLAGCAPDDFMTGRRPVVEAAAREAWPDAVVLFADDDTEDPRP